MDLQVKIKKSPSNSSVGGKGSSRSGQSGESRLKVRNRGKNSAVLVIIECRVYGKQNASYKPRCQAYKQGQHISVCQ